MCHTYTSPILVTKPNSINGFWATVCKTEVMQNFDQSSSWLRLSYKAKLKQLRNREQRLEGVEIPAALRFQNISTDATDELLTLLRHYYLPACKSKNLVHYFWYNVNEQFMRG